jgi:hypothetical protein
MPSANTVAQKPAGNVNPESSFGHDGLFVSFAEFDWLSVEAIELTRQNAATQDNRVLFRWSRHIEPSGENPTIDFITFLHAPTLNQLPHRNSLRSG